jgi:hypothetical protein
MSNAILFRPVEAFNNVGFTSGSTVNEIAFQDGFIYGISSGSGVSTLQKVALYGTSSAVTMNQTVTNVKAITNDGTYLYAVEERTSAAAATTNVLSQITTTGTVTRLQTAYLNMRSVVFDPTYNCLYISCPYDDKIVKATGGGIGGDTSTFTLTDFITGITNGPGKMWLNKASTKLFFTTEETEKAVAVSSFTLGVPSTPTYYSIMQPPEKTTMFVYLDEFDNFIYAGENKRDMVISLNLYSMNSDLIAVTQYGNGVKLDDNSIIFPDGDRLRYCYITQN